MVFHIGIVPHEGKVAAFNNETNEKTFCEIQTKVLLNNFNKNIVVQMFEEIISFIQTKKLGCICLSLNSNFGIEIREEFVQTGFKYGFNEVKVIDFKEAIFHDFFFETNIELKDGNSLWFINGKDCYIWKINGNAAIFKKFEHVYYTTAEELKRIKSDTSISFPSFILYNDQNHIEDDLVKTVFPECSLIPFKYDFGKNESNGALIKAQIISGDKNAAFEFKMSDT